jgi:hypothetical protein
VYANTHAQSKQAKNERGVVSRSDLTNALQKHRKDKRDTKTQDALTLAYFGSRQSDCHTEEFQDRDFDLTNFVERGILALLLNCVCVFDSCFFVKVFVFMALFFFESLL